LIKIIIVGQKFQFLRISRPEIELWHILVKKAENVVLFISSEIGVAESNGDVASRYLLDSQ